MSSGAASGSALLRSFIVIGVLSAATGALADPVPLTNDELKQAVSGATVEIDTPLGTTVPMRFGTDGLVSAEAGVLAPVLGASKDRGRWWVDGEKLCTKWFRWFDAQERCLTIARDGSRIHWRKIDDGETGTGTLVENKSVKPDAPAVIAKAERIPVKKATPKRDPLPAKEKPAAVPPVVAVEPVETAVAPSAPPTVVARADATAAPENLQSAPSMRFGGTGLLDHSGRAAADAAPAPDSPPAKVSAPKAAPLAKTKVGKAAAPSKPDKKRSVVARLPYETAGAASNPARQQSPATQARERTVGTETTRSVSLYKVTGVRPYDVLNVRRGPSEENVTVATIPPTGRRVEITGRCEADWCPIRYGGVKGWVNRYYLAEEGSRRDSSSPVYFSHP